MTCSAARSIPIPARYCRRCLRWIRQPGAKSSGCRVTCLQRSILPRAVTSIRAARRRCRNAGRPIRERALCRQRTRRAATSTSRRRRQGAPAGNLLNGAERQKRKSHHEDTKKTRILKLIGDRSEATVRDPLTPTWTLSEHPPIGPFYTRALFFAFLRVFAPSWRACVFDPRLSTALLAPCGARIAVDDQALAWVDVIAVQTVPVLESGHGDAVRPGDRIQAVAAFHSVHHAVHVVVVGRQEFRVVPGIRKI